MTTDYSWRQDWVENERQARLFDAWNIRDEWIPKELKWPEEMSEFSTRDKERWGVLQVRRALFSALDGARIVHRGDSPVWVDAADCSYPIVGDLDIAWEGRSPIVEVKAFIPAVRLRGGRAPACQGLDWPQRQDYLNEQTRSGRPFYVLWAWADPSVREVVIRGNRVDRLAWPPPESSPNRLSGRDQPIRRMAYWYIETLKSVQEIAEDVDSWSGAPYQPTLAIA